MLSTLRKLFVPKPPEAVNATYIALVAAARNPFFFTQLNVPDTIDGRFGLIVLHLFLVEHRILFMEGSPPAASSQRAAHTHFAQFLSEAFFNDMDHSLRELGVGDTGVSHRIKKMGKAYHGCLQAYSAGMRDPLLLRGALARNLYGTVEHGDIVVLDRMASYIAAIHGSLRATDDTAITSGHYSWPNAATLGV